MTKKARILLIDDDPDFVAVTRTVLETKPYEVITALSGDEGLEKAKAKKPDVIILDVIMPLKDGFTVCQQLKRDPDLCDVPVIMLTSFSQRYGETDLAVSQGMSLEAEDYIEKPVEPAELLRRVEKLLPR